MIPSNEVPRHKRMTLDQVMSFSFSNLIKQKQANGHWFLLSLMIVVLNMIPVGLFIMSFGENFFGGDYLPAFDLSSLDMNMGLMAIGSLTLLIAVLVDIVFAIYSSAWFFRSGLDTYDEIHDLGFGERVKRGFKDFGKLIAPILLVGLLDFIILVPYYVISIFADMTGDAGLGFEALSFVIYMLSMILIYFFAIRLICTFGLILEKDMPVMTAFKESFKMTKGRLWRIFGYMFVVGLLTMLMGLVLLIPTIILWVITAFAQFYAGLVGASILVSILSYMLLILLQTSISGNLKAAVYKALVLENTPEVVENDAVEEAPKDDLIF